MKINLENKLKQLPSDPGVYFHKDKLGEIIYIGKAANLKNRVRQYFQNSRYIDIKTKALVAEITDTDWVTTDSEIDALFLEAEMVKRYMPRYNILLRDDKSQTFVRIDMKNPWPYVSFTRNPADDSADYFGPYYNGFAVKKALRYLRKVFPYYTRTPKTESRLELDDHLGLTPVGMTSGEYKANLKKLIGYIQGNKKTIINNLKKDMTEAAKAHDFEQAAILRNKLRNLSELQRQIMFGDKEFLDISKDQALADLVDLLNLVKTPARIEGFDISHISGTNVVASMVVFSNGVSNRAEYRKFKTRQDRNDDFANMSEVISRRFSSKNLKAWGMPDLVVIDGGKGQLESAIKALSSLDQNNIPVIGLAKRDEQIIVSQGSPVVKLNNSKLQEIGGSSEPTDQFMVINLPKATHIIKLLQRIRDESHRFAVSYHSALRKTRQTSSLLDEIPGIGPKTRAKLIRKFGSVRGLKNTSEKEVGILVGSAKAKVICAYLKQL